MVEVVGERRIGDGRSIANNGIRRLLEENGGSRWSPCFISRICSTSLRPTQSIRLTAKGVSPPTTATAFAAATATELVGERELIVLEIPLHDQSADLVCTILRCQWHPTPDAYVSDPQIGRMSMRRSSQIGDTPHLTTERDGVDVPSIPTRSAWIVEHLRQALLDGSYPVGSRMNEVRLSQDLGVSRTPIRAAMQMLAGEGLLHYRPNKGFTVREFSVSDIVDAFEMRALAEGLAARLAAEKGLSAALRAKLERSLADGDAALADKADPEARRAAYARINEAFHSAVHAAAGSSLVEDVVRLCQRMPQASAHNVMAFDLTDVLERHRAHHEIYDAILGREPAEAESLMRRHVLWVKKSMVRAFARQNRD